LLIEQIPARGSNDEPARDLDDNQTDAKKRKDFAAEQERDGQQGESVGRYLARQDLLGRLRVLPGQAQENWGVPDGVYHREQRYKRGRQYLNKVGWVHSVHSMQKGVFAE
jgi:hypothetical protein